MMDPEFEAKIPAQAKQPTVNQREDRSVEAFALTESRGQTHEKLTETQIDPLAQNSEASNDAVDCASQDSFPASDPPSWWSGRK